MELYLNNMEKLLLDTNAYIRLAKDIDQLLGATFGEEEYCFFLIKNHIGEMKSNPRFKTENKFSWLFPKLEKIDSKQLLRLSNIKISELNDVYEELRQTSFELGLNNISRVDLLGLSYCLVLDITIITDDPDMIKLCEYSEIKILCILECLELMLHSDHPFITNEKIIRKIVQHWVNDNDVPKGYYNKYQELFGVKPPVKS